MEDFPNIRLARIAEYEDLAIQCERREAEEPGSPGLSSWSKTYQDFVGVHYSQRGVLRSQLLEIVGATSS